MDVREFLLKTSLMLLVYILAMIGLAFFLGGCTHGREYRIYVHDADRGLFIRDLENKEVLSYREGHGLVCMPKRDVQKLVESVTSQQQRCEEK